MLKLQDYDKLFKFHEKVVSKDFNEPSQTQAKFRKKINKHWKLRASGPNRK